jgi:hypothetical protein
MKAETAKEEKVEEKKITKAEAQMGRRFLGS